MTEAIAPARNALETLAASWGNDRDRAWYEETLRIWLGTLRNRHTARAYARAVVGFFHWLKATRGHTQPARVRTTDVDEWIQWLQQGGRIAPLGLTADQRNVLQAVTEGATTVAALERRLPELGTGALREALGVLVRCHTLATDAPFPRTEHYHLPPPRKQPLAPATVALQASALQSLFAALQGQNGRLAGFEMDSPVRASPVLPVLQTLLANSDSERAARSDRRKTRPSDWEVVAKICWERPLPRRRRQRDWTLLVGLATTGLRVQELVRVRIGQLEREGDAVFVTVRRKGGALDRIRLPGVVLLELERLHGMPLPQANAESPAFALAVHRWGAAAETPPTTPISTGHVQRLVRRIAVEAAPVLGISVEAAEARIHPHGLRHLYAQVLAEQGVPVHEIRTLLGHKSLATTDTYLTRETGKEKDHSALFGRMIDSVVR